jgi:hypothetical protein
MSVTRVMKKVRDEEHVRNEHDERHEHVRDMGTMRETALC